MKLESINFSQILKDSWQVTWKHRFLWWFGLLIALGSGGGLQFPSFNSNRNGAKNELMAQNWQRIMDQYGAWIWGGFIVLIVIAIAVWIFRTVAQAGIIRSYYQLSQGESTNFNSGFSQGKVYFWKIFFTDIIITVFIFLVAAIFSIPIIFLFIAKSYGVAVMLILAALVIFIPIAVIAGFMRKYAYYYLVLSNLNIQSALENSYLVFRRNIVPSLVMALIFIPLSLILVFAIIVALILIGIIFLILGFVAYLVSQILLWIIVGLGVLVFISIVILFRSIFETFAQAAWFYFFHQIATEKEPEAVAEKETNMVSEKISEAGVYKVEEK